MFSLKILRETKIITALENYYTYLSPLIEDNNDLSNIITQSLSSIQESVLKTNKNLGLNIENIFEAFHNHKTLDNKISQLLKFFKNDSLNPVDLSITLSLTYKNDVTKILNKLSNNYRLYKAFSRIFYKNIVDETVKMIFREILRAENKIAELDKIANMYKKWPLGIEFYVNIMHILYCLKIIPHNISSRVEKLKDKSLFIPLAPAKNAVYNNNPLKTNYRLVPSTSQYDLKTICEKYVLFGTYKGNISLETLKKFKFCFIIFNRVITKPVYYDIKKILDVSKEYDSDSGVNNKSINRFHTIIPMKDAKFNFSHKIINNPSPESVSKVTYYVLETLDGVNYRMLAPWGFAYNLGLPYHIVSGLLNALTSPATPTRLGNYQRLAIKKSLSNMFIRIPMDLDDVSNTAADPPIILQALQIRLSEHYAKITKKLHINNLTSFGKIIHDESFAAIFSNSLIKFFKKYVKITVPFSELLSTYIADLDTLTLRFKRLMHNEYNKHPPIDFNKKNLKSIFDTYLEQSLKQIITLRSNIYSSIIMKNDMLSY